MRGCHEHLVHSRYGFLSGPASMVSLRWLMIAASEKHQALLDRLPRLISRVIEDFPRAPLFRHQPQNRLAREPRTLKLMAALLSLDTSRSDSGTARRFGDWTSMVLATLAAGLIA